MEITGCGKEVKDAIVRPRLDKEVGVIQFGRVNYWISLKLQLDPEALLNSNLAPLRSAIAKADIV